VASDRIELFLGNQTVLAQRDPRSETEREMRAVSNARSSYLKVRELVPLLLSWAIILHGQAVDHRDTLPELARRSAPEGMNRTPMRELVPTSVERLLPQADLVVYGTVATSTARLSSDQKDLYTDYVIQPLRVVSQRSVMAVSQPGQTSQIVVTRWGGVYERFRGISLAQMESEIRRIVP
jgi:hypothetical protein